MDIERSEERTLTLKLFEEALCLSQYLCSHGKLNPSLAKTEMKLVSTQIWNTITNNGQVPVDVTLKENEACCRVCSCNMNKELRELKSQLNCCTRFEEIFANSVDLHASSDQLCVWVSKKWVRDFRERNKIRTSRLNEILRVSKGNATKKKQQLSMKTFLISNRKLLAEDEYSSLNINEDIICPHGGGLVPGKLCKRSILLSDWNDLLEYCEGGKWKENSKTFLTSDLKECKVCENKSKEARSEAKREREVLSNLLKNFQFGPCLKEILRRKFGHPGTNSTDFYPNFVVNELIMVPRDFMIQIRNFLEGTDDVLELPNFEVFNCPHEKIVFSPRCASFIQCLKAASKLFENVNVLDNSFGVEVEFITLKEWTSLLQVLKYAKDITEVDFSRLRIPRFSFVLNETQDGYSCSAEVCLECLEALCSYCTNKLDSKLHFLLK